MGQIVYLPGFRIAPPGNIRQIYDYGESFHSRAADTSLTQYEFARHDLRRKQECAADLGKLVGTSGAFDTPPESWQDLVSQADTWLSDHIDTRKLHRYALLTDLRGIAATIRHVKTVARDAAVTIAAYQEVTPKVLMRQDFTHPNRDIANFSQRSMGFILAWSGLHDQVDKPLAFALAASPKPASQDSVYQTELHFDPRWFKEIDGHIVLDPDKAEHLCDKSLRRHPSKNDSNRMELFGCPGRHMIPTLYKLMLEAAIKGELFAKTYHRERANHGYTEYHEVPAFTNEPICSS